MRRSITSAEYEAANRPLFNFRCFKVGGIRFLKVGRITMSFCVSKQLKGF